MAGTGGDLSCETAADFGGKVVIVWESIENHDEVVHVLLVHGRVEAMTPESLESHLAGTETKLGLKR